MATQSNQSPFSLYITFRQSDINRIDKWLSKWEGAPLQLRETKATQGGLKLLLNPIRALTPVGKTGNLLKSDKARVLPKRWGEVGAFAVGPTAHHRHLVIQGHRIVGHRPNLVDTGKRSTPNPFVYDATEPLMSEVDSFVEAEMTRLA